MAVVAVLLSPVLLLGVTLAAVLLLATAGGATTGVCDPAGSQVVSTADGWPSDPVVGGVDSDQTANAATIVSVGQQLQIPAAGIVTALAVAAQESAWRNVASGDAAGPDSRGLFQQRDSWGPVSVRMDPAGASRLFYRALVAVPGWQQLSLGAAGQRVQRSADPTGAWYSTHEPIARYAYTLFSGDTSQTICSTGTMACPVSQWPGVETGLTPDAVLVLRCATQTFPQVEGVAGIGDRPAQVDDDHATGRAVDLMITDWATPAGRSVGDQVAAWVWQHRVQLGVKYLIWDAQIISVARIGEGWRPYSNPTGATDPTSQHLDHVHVSVYGSAATQTSLGGEWVLPIAAGHYSLGTRFGVAGPHWASGHHTGLDFPAAAGTPIVSVTTGVVTRAGWGGAYGNWTCISDGPVTSDRVICYAHQSSVLVTAGQSVTAGQQIGTVGQTGNAFGAHLHLEIRQGGTTVDPYPLLTGHGLDP